MIVILSDVLNNTYLLVSICYGITATVVSVLQILYFKKKTAKLEAMLSQTGNICAFRKERKVIKKSIEKEIVFLHESVALDSTSSQKLETHLIDLDQRFSFIFDDKEQTIIKKTLTLIHDPDPDLPLLIEQLKRICVILNTERKYIDA